MLLAHASGAARRGPAHQLAIMTTALTPPQHAHIIGWAERTPCITEVRLFDSRVRGTHRPDSDIDIAVTMVSDETGPPLAIYLGDCANWEAELSSLLGIIADTAPTPAC